MAQIFPDKMAQIVVIFLLTMTFNGIFASNEALNSLIDQTDAFIKNEWHQKLHEYADKYIFLDHYKGSDEIKKFSPNFKQFDHKLKELEKTIADAMSLAQIDNAMRLSAKLNNIFPYFAHLKTAEETLMDYVENYHYDTQILIDKIDKFLTKLNDEKIEREMINFVTESSVDSHLINYFRGQNRPEACKIRTSTAKELFDFYHTILIKTLRIFAVHEVALEVRASLSGNRVEQGFLTLEKFKTRNLEKWTESVEKSFKTLVHEDFIPCIEIKKEKEVIKFKNVLQVFFEREIATPCNLTARKELRERYDRNGCYGVIRNCSFLYKIYVLESHWRHPEIPEDDRIYEGFAYGFIWYGKGSEDDKRVEFYWSNQEECMSEDFKFQYVRTRKERCICDQLDHPRTLRKIYVGRIDAPEDHVVTGVRFAYTPNHDAIFLQIQVGKLLPLMTIDETTVRWQDFPNVTQPSDYVTYDFDHRPLFYLNNGLMFDKQVLTGLQLFNSSSGITLMIFGRKIQNFTSSILDKDVEVLAGPEKGNITNGHDVGLKDSLTHQTLVNHDGAIDFDYCTEQSDAGQVFVPFFDGINVTLSTPAPLSGIGVVQYTNDKTHAGYIRPIIASLNYPKILLLIP